MEVAYALQVPPREGWRPPAREPASRLIIKVSSPSLYAHESRHSVQNEGGLCPPGTNPLRMVAAVAIVTASRLFYWTDWLLCYHIPPELTSTVLRRSTGWTISLTSSGVLRALHILFSQINGRVKPPPWHLCCARYTLSFSQTNWWESAPIRHSDLFSES